MGTNCFSVLFVCTGNVCRSAQAEQITRGRIATRAVHLADAVSVRSAGISALDRAPMPEEAARLSVAHGGTRSNHRSTQLTLSHLENADLVLVMEHFHRSRVARLFPQATRRTFLLTEFAALLEDLVALPPEAPADWETLTIGQRLRGSVKWAAGRRGLVELPEEGFAEIPDPFGQSWDIYQDSADQVVAALDRIERAARRIGRQVMTYR